MNSVHIMVIAIVAMAMIAGILKARFAAAQHRPLHDPEREKLREDVKALRERVAVLERIATDDQNRLAHEIDSLRDR
jgi:Flp pilus assembly protein CpaB